MTGFQRCYSESAIDACLPYLDLLFESALHRSIASRLRRTSIEPTNLQTFHSVKQGRQAEEMIEEISIEEVGTGSWDKFV